MSTTVLACVVVVAATLVYRTDRDGPQVLWIGAWKEPLGICLVADRLSALMLLVSAVVTLAVLVYSIGQGMTGDERETPTPLTIYHPTFLVLAAGVSNAFLAGDLFNLFVSFEMLLFASYVLLTLGGTARPDPGGHDLRGRQRAVLDAVPHLDRRGLRRHRQPQPRPAGRPASASCRHR